MHPMASTSESPNVGPAQHRTKMCSYGVNLLWLHFAKVDASGLYEWAHQVSKKIYLEDKGITRD
jgi:hypothetical protein